MEERINKEFDDYQKQLEIRSIKKKEFVRFNIDENVDNIINEIKHKEIIL